METEIVVHEPAPGLPQTLFGNVSPAELVAQATEMATALKGALDRGNLIKRIDKRDYVLIEGWTLLGTMLGVSPVLVWSRPLDNGWEARVEARTLAGVVLSAAEASCTYDERNWAGRPDFALRSMAQTRATAKALRMALGFIVSMAGFETTPAEEMVDAVVVQPPSPRRPEPVRQRTPVLAEGTPVPVCSTHNKPMKDLGRGWFCPTKAAPGEPQNANGFCTAKPGDPAPARDVEFDEEVIG